MQEKEFKGRGKGKEDRSRTDNFKTLQERPLFRYRTVDIVDLTIACLLPIEQRSMRPKTLIISFSSVFSVAHRGPRVS